MKKHFFAIVGTALLMVLPLGLNAQNRGEGQGRMKFEERAKKEQAELKKELGLKKDQSEKFDKIYADFNKKRQELMTKMRESEDRAGMRTQFEELSNKRDEALKKVLDKGQVKKYEAYLKKRAEERRNMGNRGGRGQGGGDRGGRI